MFRTAILFLLVIFFLSPLIAESAKKPIPAPKLWKAFGSADGNYRGSPLVVDINGDRQMEIISSVFGAVTVHSTKGQQLHSLKVQGRVYAGAVVGDITGDSRLEIIAGDNKANVYVWNAQGELLPGWPKQAKRKQSLSCEVRQIACADINGDDKDEIIIFTSLTDQGSEPNMYVWDASGNDLAGWPHYRHQGDPYVKGAFDHGGGFNNCLAVGDADGNGTMELFFAQDYGCISAFYHDGTPVWTKGINNPNADGSKVHWGQTRAWVPFTSEKTSWGPGKTHLLEYTYSPPLIADIDLDGQCEILSVPNSESPNQVGPITGSVLCVWNLDRTHKKGFAPYKISGTGFKNEGHEPNPTVVAGDVTGNEKLEVIVNHLDGTLRAYAADGKDLWSFKAVPSKNHFPAEPLLADLNKDGKAEVILAVAHKPSKTSELLVIDGDGNERLRFPLPFFTLSSPTLADLNGDKVAELIFAPFGKGSSGGAISIYQWPIAKTSGLVWPMSRGDNGHTGWLRKNEQKISSGKKRKGLFAKYSKEMNYAIALLKQRNGNEAQEAFTALSKQVSDQKAQDVLVACSEAAQAANALQSLMLSNSDQLSNIKSIYVYVDIDGRKKAELKQIDSDGITVTYRKKEITINWSSVTADQFAGIVSKFTEKDNLEQQRALAYFSAATGSQSMAKKSFSAALALDATLKDQKNTFNALVKEGKMK